MRQLWHTFKAVWSFYAPGFREMTWGRTLWLLIIVKLLIFFGVLRLFFFRPTLSGLDAEQKSERVGQELRR